MDYFAIFLIGMALGVILGVRLLHAFIFWDEPPFDE